MLEILEAASFELIEASGWYDERVSGLGDRFLAELQDAFELIDRNPASASSR